VKVTETEGIVRKMEAHTVGYSADKRVVGTMVTVQTRISDDKGTVDVDTGVFLHPNSVLPKMGDSVTVIIASQEDVELMSLSDSQRMAIGATEDEDE